MEVGGKLARDKYSLSGYVVTSVSRETFSMVIFL